jgi:hypothetical protein
MAYAADDKISKQVFENSIEITDLEYVEARTHLLTKVNGKFGLVKVFNNQLILTYKPDSKEGFLEPVWQNGVWYFEPKEDEDEGQVNGD